MTIEPLAYNLPLLTVDYASILSYARLKYQASMVTYVCFETVATGVAVNCNLHGDTMNKSVAEMPPTRY